jgi:hypothetical protein
LRDAVKLLRDITGDLRRVIGSDNWSVDWTQYDAQCKAAEQAEDPTQALRSHASAMRALMQQIHEEHSRRASDSGIEL